MLQASPGRVCYSPRSHHLPHTPLGKAAYCPHTKQLLTHVTLQSSGRDTKKHCFQALPDTYPASSSVLTQAEGDTDISTVPVAAAVAGLATVSQVQKYKVHLLPHFHNSPQPPSAFVLPHSGTFYCLYQGRAFLSRPANTMY